MSGDVNIQTTNEEWTEFVKRNQKERKDHIGDTNKMVTAVEWLVEQLRQLAFNQKTHLGMGDVRVTQGLLDDLLEQAKAMEKSNMIWLLQWMNKVASDTPMRLETDLDDIVEQYYNETYNK